MEKTVYWRNIRICGHTGKKSHCVYDVLGKRTREYVTRLGENERKKEGEEKNMKYLELSKKLAVLGKIYRMKVINESQYLLMKTQIMQQYGIVRLMETN